MEDWNFNLDSCSGKTCNEVWLSWKLDFKTFLVVSAEIWSCLLTKHLLLHLSLKLGNRRMVERRDEYIMYICRSVFSLYWMASHYFTLITAQFVTGKHPWFSRPVIQLVLWGVFLLVNVWVLLSKLKLHFLYGSAVLGFREYGPVWFGHLTINLTLPEGKMEMCSSIRSSKYVL